MRDSPSPRCSWKTLMELGLRLGSFLLCLALLSPHTLLAEGTGTQSGKIALNFNDVEISVFVRFISELTGKNFVLDETIKKQAGKISVFSPTKVTPDQAFRMFVSALEVARLAVVPKESVYQIVPMGELPPERGVYVYKLKHANATDLVAVLTNLVARSQTVAQPAPGARPPIRPRSEFEAPAHPPGTPSIRNPSIRDSSRKMSRSTLSFLGRFPGRLLCGKIGTGIPPGPPGPFPFPRRWRRESAALTPPAGPPSTSRTGTS